MNCRKFDKLLPELICGKLPVALRNQMEEHKQSCTACRRLENAERLLISDLKAMTSLREQTDLWPRIVTRLDTQVPAPRFHFARKFKIGLAMAACILAGFVFLRKPADIAPSMDNPTVISSSEEQHVVKLVADMKMMPDTENDTLGSEMNDHRNSVRMLLTGVRGDR